MNSKQTQSPETLADLIHELWSVKIHIALGAGMGLAIGLLYTIAALSTYKVTMIIGAVPSIAAQISIENSVQSPFIPRQEKTSNLTQMNQSMYRTIYRSPRIAGMILKIPEQVQAIAYDKKYGLLSLNPSSWTADDMSKYLEKRVKLAPAQGTIDLMRVTYTHPNPDFAKGLLMQLHALTDESIRNDHKKTHQ